jgi:bidirectional [NiFe] hydrogenase diaphorase subunit
MNLIKITINDKVYDVELNSTILDACKLAGIEILTMCHLDGISDVGACRLCLVEVEGSNKLLPACTTKVTANMVIHTETERLKNYQRISTELLFA